MCRSSRSGSPDLGAAVTVVAVTAVAVAVARPVLHAAETVLEVALIAAAAAAGLAALAAVAFIVIHSHRRQARALRATPSRALPAGRPVPAIPAPRVLAIEGPRQAAAEPLCLDEAESMGLAERARELVQLSGLR
jgi:hypothetical protein